MVGDGRCTVIFMPSAQENSYASPVIPTAHARRDYRVRNGAWRRHAVYRATCPTPISRREGAAHHVSERRVQHGDQARCPQNSAAGGLRLALSVAHQASRSAGDRYDSTRRSSVPVSSAVTSRAKGGTRVGRYAAVWPSSRELAFARTILVDMAASMDAGWRGKWK